jgi:hypothetical protein
MKENIIEQLPYDFIDLVKQNREVVKSIKNKGVLCGAS